MNACTCGKTTAAPCSCTNPWPVATGRALALCEPILQLSERYEDLVSQMCPLVEDAPEFLSGDEGETHFVRRDTADNRSAALAVGLLHGYHLQWETMDEVEMLPVPDYFTEIDYEWGVVKPGTPNAVRYWRFRV